MSLQRARAPGIYRHWAPVKDKERPSFLFSSDIPYKISTCVAELHLYQGGCSRKVVDLSKYIVSFDITLGLNSLILRNKNITPSELSQKNHIYVSKSRSSGRDTDMTRSLSRFPQVWKSILATQSDNETFVVGLRLHIDTFSVDLSDSSDIRLRLHADEPIHSVLDREMIKNLETYIKHNLLQELKSNSDISSLIADSSTILQDSPPNESHAQFKSSFANVHSESIGFADMSLDDYDSTCTIEKQLAFYDNDFDDSGDEMKLLHSDESGKCTSNADEESDSGLPHFLPLRALDSELSKCLLDHNLPRANSYQMASDTALPMLSLTEHELTSDNTTSDYGRHGDKTSLTSAIDDHSEGKHDVLGPRPKLSTSVNAILEEKDLFAPRDEILGPTFEEFCKDVSLQESEFEDTISSPIASPTKQKAGSGGLPSLKKKSSLSFIDHDDGSGLDFAFRHSSSPVPEYIKENKKFKFIKVGKVQKFVNMFEEHKETPSSSSSRTGTRPGSPIRKIDSV